MQLHPRALVATALALWVGPGLCAAAPGSPAPGAPARPKRAAEKIPTSLPGTEAFVYRKIGDTELRLFVAKPGGWTARDRRTCLVAFYGGGWNDGTPARIIAWAHWAAAHGCVGVAPQYRTRDGFGGTPEDCVADGRAAVRWVADHAAELGIDPGRIVALGSSAGGHVAAWTAIPKPGPGADDPAPRVTPAALVLLNPVTRTTDGGYGGTKRFGGSAERALAASVPDQMPPRMPPTIVFHALGDKTVPYGNSASFRDQMVRNGNACELVTFEGLGHAYSSNAYGEPGRRAGEKTKVDVEAFLRRLGLLGAAPPAAPR